MGGGGLPLSPLAPTSTPVGTKLGCSPLSFYEGASLRCVDSPPHLQVDAIEGVVLHGLLMENEVNPLMFVFLHLIKSLIQPTES